MGTLDSISALERLAALHQSGALTAAEFAEQKRRLLNGDYGGDEPVTPSPSRASLAATRGSQPPASPSRPVASGSGSKGILWLVVLTVGAVWTLSSPGIREKVGLLAGAMSAPSAPGDNSVVRPAYVAAPQVPQPVLVQTSKSSDRSTLFHMKLDVTSEVLNNGAAGYITVYCDVNQDGRTWTRQDRRYMEPGERALFTFAFNRLEKGATAEFVVRAEAN